MIPEEQIKQLAVSCGFKLTNETGDDLKPYVYEFAGDVIALAQQVKPLGFEREHGCLWCKTSIGEYSIHPYKPDNGFVVELDECQEDDDVYETEEKAITAAQQDYQRRVLSCLVHGGV